MSERTKDELADALEKEVDSREHTYEGTNTELLYEAAQALRCLCGTMRDGRPFVVGACPVHGDLPPSAASVEPEAEPVAWTTQEGMENIVNRNGYLEAYFEPFGPYDIALYTHPAKPKSCAHDFSHVEEYRGDSDATHILVCKYCKRTRYEVERVEPPLHTSVKEADGCEEMREALEEIADMAGSYTNPAFRILHDIARKALALPDQERTQESATAQEQDT